MGLEKPSFYGSWKGRIIKAIAVDGARTWEDIKEMTGLYPNTMNQVLAELFSEEAIHKVNNNEYRVKKDLYNEYTNFFKDKQSSPKIIKVTTQEQEKIERIVQEWKDNNNLKIDLKDKHFFLFKRNLDDFSKSIIRKAQKEIIVVNPFVERCDLTESLLEVSNEVNIKMFTRSIPDKNYNFMRQLHDHDIMILVNDIIHAKIIVVDRGVTIVSSMNFYAGSSGGKTWEAGIISLSEKTVLDVLDAILTIEEDYDTEKFK